MTTLLAFLLAIAVLVVIHELGHYWVARWCGVKVLRFSVGFGKTIYSKRFTNGETEWVISAVPLGGYVKMLDEREGEVEAHELHRAFNRQPVLRRMAIALAGPAANFLLAIALYWTLFMVGVPGIKPVLGEVLAQSPAAAAQLQVQDTIVSIDGQAVSSWEEARWILLNMALQKAETQLEIKTVQGEVRQRVLNLGSLTAADLDADFLRKLGLQPFRPDVPPVIGKLTPDGVAERGGLRTGDRILSVDGINITHWTEFVESVRSHPEHVLHLELERNGSLLSMEITPQASTEGSNAVGKIGAAPHIDQAKFDALLTEVSYAPIPAARRAVQKTWEVSRLSLQMLGKMVLGEVSLKNLSGPITIADYAGQTARMGAAAYLGFLALVSVSLGVLNLLPVPLLDGGHLLYYTVELIKGSPVSEKMWAVGQNVGIALLVTLTAFALFNDISRLFG